MGVKINYRWLWGYVVNCIAKNGKYLIIWVFKSDDGKFRYVSLEGTPEVLKDMIPLIEESWTVKKELKLKQDIYPVFFIFSTSKEYVWN